MRHKKKINHLSRKRGHRHAMLSNMATSLIMHKRITTTTAKAKALKIFVEPLITKAKSDTTHSRRQVFKYLQDKEATAELFREVAEKVADRPGGYTRIIKLGNRLGDNADMCIIELVDYNENLLAEKEASKKSSRRRRGGKKKSTETTAQTGTSAPKEKAAGDATAETSTEEAAAEPAAEAAETTADVKEEVPAEETKTEEATGEAEKEAPAAEKKAEEPVAEAADTEEKKEEAPAAEKADDDTTAEKEEKKEGGSEEEASDDAKKKE